MKKELVVPGITNAGTLICLARARKYEQYCRAVDNAVKGICPFCTLDTTYNQVVIKDQDGWRVWLCQPPEKNTLIHLIIAPLRHVTDLIELTTGEWVRLQYIFMTVKEKYEISSCGILIRNGDATLSAGTVQHLHIHVMVPDGTGRVESPFFKGREAEEEGLARAIVFEKMRQGARFEDLALDEQELVVCRL
jgi:ATP adenylyltransferase